MMYQDAGSFRHALEHRLKQLAAGDEARLARDRKRVAFDRFLVRLNAIAPDRWLLKGGFALDLRLAGRARATKDIDLDWRDVDDELLDTLLDAAEHDAGDFFVFSIERSGALADRIAGGQRFRVSASLAGRAFETFPLDVALRAEPMLAADTLTTPDLLAFAGLGPVRVPALPLERQAAEKLHAYTRIYEGERPSSRTKDLVDIVLIAELAALDAAKLWSAIGTTFTMRGTHPMMLLQRADNQYSWEYPDTPELPSVTARRMWYDTVGHGHIPALRSAVETFGADRLVLGTDFPYENGDIFVRAIDYIFASGITTDAETILESNAMALFGLKNAG